MFKNLITLKEAKVYQSLQELLQIAEEKQVTLWEVILQNEMKVQDCDEKTVWKKLKMRLDIMKSSANKALEGRRETKENGQEIEKNLINGLAKQHQQYSESMETLSGSFVNRVMALALSSSEVNARMGKICAAPTAGSCGILPAVLIGIQEKLDLNEREVLQGLMTASGIGAVVVKNATVSGAEGGCQAECGVAAAMAAAAAVEMRGGTPRQAIHSVALTLINCMGLICDPIAGLVQVPCAQRNASQAVNALISADLALGGMKSIIPADEVIEAMYHVGKQLPVELKETALGGLAATTTGKELVKYLLT